MGKSLGERIKTLRKERKMTLAELSQQTNLSTSYLSQVERDKTTPSISSLVDLANALQVNMRYFFEEDQGSELAFVTRKSLTSIQESENSVNEMVALTPVEEPSRLRVWQYTLEPSKSISVEIEEQGENFCIILRGELVITIATEDIILREGDSAAFDAPQSCTLRNGSGEDCVVLFAFATMQPTVRAVMSSLVNEKEVQ